MAEHSPSQDMPGFSLTAEEKLCLLTWVCYGLHLLGFGIVAIVINYLKRPEARQHELYGTHFDWQIETFWIGLIGALIGFALSVILVGWLVVVGEAG